MTTIKHVLMLVNTHVYDDRRVVNEATSLSKASYQVSIIGAARKSGVQPIGAIENIPIILTPMTTRLRELPGAIWRLIRSDVSGGEGSEKFVQTTVLSLLMFNLWVLRLGLTTRFEVVHCHDFSPLPAAWLLAKLKRARLIYDSHEHAPDLYAGKKSHLVRRVENWFLPRVDVVLTVGQRLARTLRERGGRQVVVLYNGKTSSNYVLTDGERQQEREQLGIGEAKLVVVFIGALEPVYLLLPLIEAVVASPGVALFIGGDGLLCNEVIARTEGKVNIHWLGWVTQDKVAYYTSLSDVVYICLTDASEVHRGSHIYYATPNKIFESLASGRAALAVRGVGEMSEILEQTGSAFFLDEVTPQSLKDAFIQLQHPEILRPLQERGIERGKAYEWSEVEKVLLQIYSEL